MISALIALLGVIVGAIVTGLVGWVAARRKEIRETFAAIRLVHAELLENLVVFEELVDQGATDVAPYVPFAVDAWNTGRAQLGPELDDEAWAQSVRCFSQLGMINRGLLKSEATSDVRAMRDTVARALSYVEPHAHLNLYEDAISLRSILPRRLGGRAGKALLGRPNR